MRIQFVVPRRSADETTFAIVSCIATADMCNSAALLDGITKAVTEWIKTEQAGKNAWENSSRDLNIGDLSYLYRTPSLTTLLAKHGVLELEIETHCNDDPVAGWSYDTVLADLDELEEVED